MIETILVVALVLEIASFFDIKELEIRKYIGFGLLLLTTIMTIFNSVLMFKGYLRSIKLGI
jgi:hypothetical protein